MRTDEDLTAQPIPQLVKKMAIPASVGLFFNTMYNVVDTYFGGLISTQALAALSLSFPIFFIIISIGSGLSTGATALMATSAGAGNSAQVRLFAVQGVTYGLILSLIVTLFGIWSSPFLFSTLGASGIYLDVSLQYMNTIFAGSCLYSV